MRILAFSDLHADTVALVHITERAKSVDMVAVAGDLTDWPPDNYVLEIELRSVRRFLSDEFKLHIKKQLLNEKVKVWHKGKDIKAEFPSAIGELLSPDTAERLAAELFLRIGVFDYQSKQIADILEALGSIKCLSAIVLGNIDHPWLRRPIEYITEKPDARLKYINRTIIQYMGWKFFGYDGAVRNGVQTINDWGEELCRREMRSLSVDLMEARPLVVISHCPPFNCLDSSVKYGSRHIGSQALREVVEQTKPRYFICGHSHLSGGKTELLGDTLVINVATAQIHPRYGGRYAIIDTDESTVNWFRLH